MIIVFTDKTKFQQLRFITMGQECAIILQNYIMLYYILWDINVFMFLDMLLKKMIVLMMILDMLGLW